MSVSKKRINEERINKDNIQTSVCHCFIVHPEILIKKYNAIEYQVTYCLLASQGISSGVMTDENRIICRFFVEHARSNELPMPCKSIPECENSLCQEYYLNKNKKNNCLKCITLDKKISTINDEDITRIISTGSNKSMEIAYDDLTTPK